MMPNIQLLDVWVYIAVFEGFLYTEKAPLG